MIWKLYFWIMVVLIAVATFGMGSSVHWRVHLVDWLNLAFTVIGMAGVFGYAFKHKVGTKSFWLVFTFVALIYQLAYSFILDQKYGASPATSTADGLVTFVPLIPMFIALYFYHHRIKSF